MGNRGKRGRRRPPVGARPGTLVVSEHQEPSQLSVLAYDEKGVEEVVLSSPSELSGLVGKGRCLWLDVEGLGDAAFLRQLGQALSIHPLALEDVVHVPQRPKAEEYDDNLLLISQAHVGEVDHQVEQVSLLLGGSYVVTFREAAAAGILDPVRARLRDGKGPMRRMGSGYLAYAILDAVVDGYFPQAERLAARIEALETEILQSPEPAQLERLNHLRSEVQALRRAAWSQREALSKMMRDLDSFMDEKVRIYLRDVQDHCHQIVESCDSQRELVNGLMNMYLSVVSNRMNEVMKVLTIMASIFVPLTFLAGIYGMNFEYMPELGVRWAYPVLLTLMVGTVAGMLIYFYRKGWIGGSSRGGPGEGSG